VYFEPNSEMNSTNSNVTTAVFTFTAVDGIYVSFQLLVYLFIIFLIFILFLFRKEKALKSRGCLPYFSIIGIFFLSIRFFFSVMSSFKIGSKTSFTSQYKKKFFKQNFSFSCWWGLLVLNPIFVIFIVAQTLHVFQYLINKRIDVLKDLTWEFLDQKQTKVMEIISKKIKSVTKVKSNRNSVKLSTSKSPSSVGLLEMNKSPETEILSKDGSSEKLNLEKEIYPEKFDLLKIENLPQVGSSEDMDLLRQKSTNLSEESISPKINLHTEDTNSNRESKMFDMSERDAETTDMNFDIDDEYLTEMKWLNIRLKVAKFFASFWFKLIVLVLIYFFTMSGHTLVHGIIEASSPHTCTFVEYPFSFFFSSLLTPFLTITLFLSNLILISVDIIVFLKESGFDLKKYFLIDDPFGFRIEQAIGVVLLFFAVIISFFPPTILLIAEFVPGITEVEGVRGIVSSLVVVLIAIFFQIFILIILISVGLGISILSFIKRKRGEPEIFDSEFDAFINTKKGREIFKKFAKQEWSLENILFYEQIDKYKKIKIVKVSKKRANEILANFIEPGSVLEVNLAADVRKSTKNKVINFKKDDYKDIFDDAIKETKRNMRDTFGRIRKTEAFQNWKNFSKVVIETDAP
jgi:hypothetical protein